MKNKSILQELWAADAPLGLIFLLLLTGCAGEAPPQVLTKLQVEHVTVPVGLLAVADEPAVPNSRMQSAAADYIVRLKINDDECHLDVGAIAATQR